MNCEASQTGTAGQNIRATQSTPCSRSRNKRRRFGDEHGRVGNRIQPPVAGEARHRIGRQGSRWARGSNLSTPGVQDLDFAYASAVSAGRLKRHGFGELRDPGDS